MFLIKLNLFTTLLFYFFFSLLELHWTLVRCEGETSLCLEFSFGLLFYLIFPLLFFLFDRLQIGFVDWFRNFSSFDYFWYLFRQWQRLRFRFCQIKRLRHSWCLFPPHNIVIILILLLYQRFSPSTFYRPSLIQSCIENRIRLAHHAWHLSCRHTSRFFLNMHQRISYIRQIILNPPNKCRIDIGKIIKLHPLLPNMLSQWLRIEQKLQEDIHFNCVLWYYKSFKVIRVQIR